MPLAAAVSASPRSASRAAFAPRSRKRVAARLHRVVEPAHPQVDRRQHFPAAAIVGIAFEMAFDLRHEAIDRALLDLSGGTGREHRFGQMW